MNKILIALAASVAMASAGYADSNSSPWFDGGLTGTQALTGGVWTNTNVEGVSLGDNKYVLEDVELSANFGFEATTKYAPGLYTNLIFTTAVKFDTTYTSDDLPEVPAGAKAGIIAVETDAPATNYYVLGKQDSANVWIATSVSAEANFTEAKTLTVTITNSDNYTVAIYKAGDTTIASTEVVVTENLWGIVYYSGSGEITDLVGNCKENFITPPGVPAIPEEKQDELESWCEKNNIAVNEFSSTTTGSNGLTTYQSFALGVDTNETVEVAVAGTTDVVTFNVASTNIDGVTYKTSVNGVDKTAGAAVDLSEAESRQVIVVYAVVGGQDVKVATEGVDPIASTNSTPIYIPVAFTDAGEGDIAISNIFKEAELADGDQIDVFDTAGNTWRVWSRVNGIWTPAQGADANQKLAPGMAIKFTPKSTKKRYTMGAYDESKLASTTITATPANGSFKYNLVANPNNEATQLSKFDNTAKMYKKDGNDVLPNTNYKHMKAGWKTKCVTNNTWSTSTVDTIPAGGFFLVSPSTSVEW